MLSIGQFNLLEIIETLPAGAILDGGGGRQLLLPADHGHWTRHAGDKIEVFVYPDGTGRLVATTLKPLAVMDQVAWLEVVDVNATGAFVDWGLPKNLFIPFAEQQHPLSKGQHTLVKVYLDNQNRIAGSTRIDHWIKDDASGLGVGDRVSLIIADKTDLGFKAVINHRSWGLLYANELFQRVRKGRVVEGYIKRIRADDKIDLSLNKPGFDQGKINSVTQQIIDQLEANNGHLPLTDKSPPSTLR